MSLEGTRFEKLQSSIRNEIRRKRKGFVDDNGVATTVEQKMAKKKRSDDSPTKQSKIDVRSKPATNHQPDRTNADGVYNNDRTVYIQGLPFGATEDDVRSLFESAGSIESIRLPRWQDSGRLRGYGHVAFKRAESATRALEFDGEYIQDRYISVDRPQNPRALSKVDGSSGAVSQQSATPPPGCRTVFVKNLPYGIAEEAIQDSFKVYGPIKTVRIAIWNHTGKQKGFCYIEFKRSDSAIVAVQKSGSITIQGRPTVVDYETGAPKGSYKGSSKKPASKISAGQDF